VPEYFAESRTLTRRDGNRKTVGNDELRERVSAMAAVRHRINDDPLIQGRFADSHDGEQEKQGW
jgi:hypothetical protein